MTEKDEVQISEAKLLEAMKKGDVVLLDSLLDNKLVFHIPTGQVITKEMDLENYRSGLMKVYQVSARNQKVTVYNDFATVSVEISLLADFSGNPIQGVFQYLRIWKKSDYGKRKVIAGSGIQIQ